VGPTAPVGPVGPIKPTSTTTGLPVPKPIDPLIYVTPKVVNPALFETEVTWKILP
jgi:hypothetical protein